MATTFYFDTSTTPAVSPAYDANWEQTGEAARAKLTRKGQLSVVTALADAQITVPTTTTQDILVKQFVSDPMPSQYIAGTVSAVVRYSESHADANATMALVVNVVSQDGSVLRGTLYSVFGTGTEFATTANTRIVSAVALTPLVALPGDRIVIEVGVRTTSPASAKTAIARFGTNALTDFALTAALTTDLNPWIQFSQNLFTDVKNYKYVTAGDGISVGERIR